MLKSTQTKYFKDNSGVVLSSDYSYYHYILSKREEDAHHQELENKLNRLEALVEKILQNNV